MDPRTSSSEAEPTTTVVAVRRRRRRVAAATAGTAVLLGATLATLASVSATGAPDVSNASSREPRAVQVSGELIPKDASGLAYRVAGELIGTWSFPESETEVVYASKSGDRVFLQGTEHFSGCLNVNFNTTCEPSEPTGTFRSNYISWSYKDSAGRYVDGGCTHVPTGGSKAFRGVRGFLQMKDVFAATAAGSTSIYQGEIILNAENEKAVDIPPAAASRTSASSKRAVVGC